MSQYFNSLIAHRRHKLIKIGQAKSKIKCLKIFTFAANDERGLQLYKEHFQSIKEWLRLRYSGKSLLMTMNYIEVKIEQGNVEINGSKITHLKVWTNFNSQPNLENYYERLEQNQEKSPFEESLETYLYFFQEFFQVILKGGTIKNFFYSPKNFFINRLPIKSGNQLTNIFVNYISTVGLEFLYLQRDIIKQDLQEIFALLPTNLQALPQDQFITQINRIIKMKALGWNILSFALKFVPNILAKDKLNATVTFKEVIKLLEFHDKQKTFRQLLEEEKSTLLQVEVKTGIALTQLLSTILVDNCDNLTWEDIYSELFLKNKMAQERKNRDQKTEKSKELHPSSPNNPPLNLNSLKSKKTPIEVEESFKLSNRILKGYWEVESQQTKQFYKDRSIPQSSNVYFLVRTNISFRSMMRHLNVLYFLDETSFSSDILKVHLSFMRRSFESIKAEYVSPDALIPYKDDRIPLSPPNNREQGVDQSIVLPTNFIRLGMSRISGQREGQQIKLTHEMAKIVGQISSRSWKS